MGNIQANLLADTYEMAYGLVKFYTSNLKEADPHQQWEVNGQKLNSIAWINAHLCWSEDFLLIRGTGGPSPVSNWLNHYQLGSDGSLHEAGLDIKAVLDLRKIIHEAAIKHIRSLTDEDLLKENLHRFKLGPDTTIRSIIQHAIRHEGSHAGHLGWLCKINGLKTV